MVGRAGKWVGVAATLAALGAFGLPAAGAQQPVCENVNVPVTLGAESQGGDFIYGELCRRSGARPATVVVLVHGATYNHLYWDFPYDPPGQAHYSMVRALTFAGYATFAIDLIAAGKSSHPLSFRVTTEREADILHQLVTGLRAGQLGVPPAGLTFTPFAKVVTGGHSSGSVIAWTEAAIHRDVDGLIATGALAHRFNHSGLVTECLMPPAGFQPAIFDPKFANSGLDPGYLTSGPDFRETCMHDPENRDATVVALDEENKDTVSATGEATLAQNINNTANVTTHVLLPVGERDVQFCGGTAGPCTEASVAADEGPFYPRVASLEVFVLPRAGHAMNLAPNAIDWYAAAIGWLDRRVGGASPAN